MAPALRAFVRCALVAPIGAILLVAACSSVNARNYQRIEPGMSRDEVYSIIGKPDEVSGGGIDKLLVSAEVWRGRDQTIRVVFGGDSVAVKTIEFGKSVAN